MVIVTLFWGRAERAGPAITGGSHQECSSGIHSHSDNENTPKNKTHIAITRNTDDRSVANVVVATMPSMLRPISLQTPSPEPQTQNLILEPLSPYTPITLDPEHYTFLYVSPCIRLYNPLHTLQPPKRGPQSKPILRAPTCIRVGLT